MPSGTGIGTGPANMPAISPLNELPRRSEITEASASFIDCATGPANFAHDSSVSSTQPARVSICVSPDVGSNVQAVSSHRLASLSARRAMSADCALTVPCEPSAFAFCNAMDLASFTLIGPDSTVCFMSPNVFSPPAVNACMSDCTSSGLGSLPISWLISCSRISSGSCESWFHAISPCTGPKQSMNHCRIAFSSMVFPALCVNVS